MTRRALASAAIATVACRGPHELTVGADGSEASSTSTTTESSGSDTSSSESSTESTTTETSGPPPSYEACEEPEAYIDVIREVTPYGVVEVEEGWVGALICSGVPFFELRARGVSRDSQVFISLAPVDTLSLDTPLLGPYPAMDHVQNATGTITFLESTPGLGGSAEPSRHVHALLELTGDGWDFAVEVDFIHCGVWTCDCPCE